NSLTLTSPNGGEVWQVGSNQNITWASTGTITNIRIEYSTNAGATFSVITGSTPNTGSYTWTVLNSPTAFARIRIADVSNPATHNDVSETNFTIAPPSAPVITITLPNGGENFVIGSNSAINWTTAGTLNNVRIEYSTNGGASFSFITVNTPNTGTYLWNVPNSATSAARIRISDALNPTVTSDMSDANFNIVHSSTPTITITSPNGGEDWSIGTLRYITWTTNGLPSYAVMKIEYSVNGVNGPYTVITTFGTNSGSYYWVPPGPVSSNARIRISTVAQSVTVSDVSDADFTMSPALGITITSPNGGENWKINSFKNITWNSSGSISNVKIEYSTNGNTTFSLVAASAPNTGSYTWQVPGPATPYGSMRISAVGNPSVRDLSNTFFTVSTQTPGVPEPPDTRATMSSFEPETTIPDVFALHEAYPNPFNPLTVIRYQLSVNSQVSLKVYNILGNEVVTLVDEMQDAGYKSITFDANELPSGIYYYRLQAGTFSDMKKVLLIK
ncbi:MAG: T9SS type A sorting domain-containing protein, partial [Bacteroidetes bacterium]